MSRVIALACVASLSGVASGQSFNIDFSVREGVPPSTFGAPAGQPGVWNGLSVDTQSGPFALVDLAGDPIATTLDASEWEFDVAPSGSSETGPAAPLLNDYAASSSNDATIGLTGLQDGLYEIYSVVNFGADFGTPTVRINGDERVVGGEVNIGLIEGRSYARHSTTVTGGTLDIEFLGTNDAVVNGIQVVLVPGPGAAVAAPLGLAALTLRRRR